MLAFEVVEGLSQTVSLEPEVVDWLDVHGWGEVGVEALAGDVSTRRYFRLTRDAAADSAILALYPEPLLPACARFVLTSALLSRAAVPVPEILAADRVRGYMLVSDAGRSTLHDLGNRPWSELRPYFDRALELADRISALPVAGVQPLLPPLGYEPLLRELRQTWDFFLLPEGLVGVGAEQESWWRQLDGLCAELGQLEAMPCHRDFMARNLVPMSGAVTNLWVLDHQDLRLGPPHYDWASMLNDSLFPPDSWTEERLAERFATRADRRAFHLAVGQRTLKAVGTYAVFASRGMKRHLPLIRPTLERALVGLEKLPEVRPLIPAFRRRLTESPFC